MHANIGPTIANLINSREVADIMLRDCLSERAFNLAKAEYWNAELEAATADLRRLGVPVTS